MTHYIHYKHIYVHITLSHLRSKEFTSIYFSYKPVVSEISWYIPDWTQGSDHKIFNAKAAFYIASTNSVSFSLFWGLTETQYWWWKDHRKAFKWVFSILCKESWSILHGTMKALMTFNFYAYKRIKELIGAHFQSCRRLKFNRMVFWVSIYHSVLNKQYQFTVH